MTTERSEVSTPAPAELGPCGVVDEDLEHILGGLESELEMLEGARLLVTGGGGFLGYYLVQAPLYRNRSLPRDRRTRVTVWDNFARGRPGWLTELQDRNRELTLRRHDVTGPLPEDVPNFDYVIHAASIASPHFYRRHPIATMDANVGGLRRLLEYAREREAGGHPLQGFLFFSSSEIYGDPDPAHIPTSEDYWGHVSCTGPRACYDESKRFGETLCVNFARMHGTPVTAVRPFNNYGPGMKITDRRVIADFARDILAEEDIVMLSDGSPTRTFCYVADAVTGYFKALIHGRRGEAYNIGVEEPEISIAELAQRMVAVGRDLWGYRGSVERRAPEESDYLTHNPSRRRPSIEKARSELGYAPGILLDEGLRKTLLWYRANPSGPEG